MQLIPMDGSAAPLAAGPFSPQESRPSPIKKIHSLMQGRYKFAIPLAIVGAAVCGTLGYRSTSPMYRSEGCIEIRPTNPAYILGASSSSPMPMFDQFMDAQVQKILSVRTVDQALSDPEWQTLGWGRSEAERDAFGQQLAAIRGGQTIRVYFADRNPRVAAQAVKSVVRAYKDLYKEYAGDDDQLKLDELSRQRQKNESDQKQLRERLYAMTGDSTPEALQQTYNFKVAELNRIDSELRQASTSLRIIEEARKAAATQPATSQPGTAAVKGEAAGTPSGMAGTGLNAKTQTAEELALGGDTVMRDLLRDRMDAEDNLSELLTRFAEQHQMVKNAQKRLDVINERITSRMQQRGGVDANGAPAPVDSVNVLELRQRVRQYMQLKEAAEAETADLGKKVTQIREIQGSLEAATTSLESVKRELEIMAAEQRIGGRLNIIDEGGVPLQPFQDKRRQFAVMGGMGGAMAGFGLILLLGFLDQRVKSLADIQVAFKKNQRLLGILPTLPDDLADPEQAAFAAHCVHRIRTMLEVGQDGGRRRVLAITSPMPGDGKTSLALALGLSFAAADSKTLLIDCDVVGGGLTSRMKAIIRRKMGEILCRQGLLSPEQLSVALGEAQRTGRRLGEVIVDLGYLTKSDIDHALILQKESTVGLLDVLDGAPLEECITGTGTPGLSILPLGSARANLTGQISPKAIRRIVEESRRNFDVTLIDTGPLLGSLETSVIAAEADEVILAVARGEQRNLAEKTIDHLHAIGARLSGIVYNRAKAEDIEASDFSPSTRLSIMRSQPDELSVIDAVKRNGSSSRLGPVAGAVVSSTNVAHEQETRVDPGQDET